MSLDDEERLFLLNCVVKNRHLNETATFDFITIP